jgi:hypothetical protein
MLTCCPTHEFVHWHLPCAFPPVELSCRECLGTIGLLLAIEAVVVARHGSKRELLFLLPE